MATDQSKLASSGPPLALVAVADPSFQAFLEYILRHIGFAVTIEGDFSMLPERAQHLRPDLLLLESRLPGLDVPPFCAHLRLDRRTRTLVVLVLAAEGDEESEREIRESGADEYLPRPFTPDALIASIRALMREKAQFPEPGVPDLLTFLDVELDLVSYQVRRNGRMIRLAPTEFRLLYHLMKNPRRVYSRDELQNAAWPRAVHLGPRTVDVHIGRLRAALNEPGGQELIRTVRSVGYALSD